MDDPSNAEPSADLVAARRRISKLERENARLMDRLVEQQQLTDASRMANLAVLEHLDLDDVLATLLHCLAQLVTFDAACVMLIDEPGVAVVASGVGYDDDAVGVTLQVAERAHLEALVHTMASVRIDDTHADPGWQQGIEVSASTRSWLGVPLIARGQVIGLFGLDSRRPSFFNAAHTRRAEGLAAHAALAIANARLIATLSAAT